MLLFRQSLAIRTCKCGCGLRPKPGNFFINGHNPRMFSKETRQKLSKSSSEKHWKGIKFSEQARKNISESHKGLKQSKETCLKRSLTSKGRTQSKEWIKKRVETRKRNNNYSLSDETKKKISKSHRGFKHSEEHKRYMSNLFKGRKPSQATIDGIKRARTGVPISEDHKRKLSKFWTGRPRPEFANEKHWNWRGGKSREPYPIIEWNSTLRTKIKRRDNNECQNPDCSKEFLILTVHHIDYNKQNCSELNLVILCKRCNSLANFNRRSWQRLYKRIIWNKYRFKYL